MHNAPVRRIPGIGVMTYGNDLSLLFLVWTTIGASILTFAGPFTYTGNGYFASWGLVVGSILAVGSTLNMDTIRTHSASLFWSYSPSRRWCCILFGVTVIQLCSAMCHPDAMYEGDGVHSVFLGILTMLLIVTFGYFLSLLGRYTAVVFSFWSILWLILAFVITSRHGSFHVTGNGYFSVWGGFLLCIRVATSTTASPSSELQP